MNLREWALPVYTILIQLAAGAFLALWIGRSFSRREREPELLDELVKIPLLIIFATIIVAIVGAHFHLSKPLLSVFALMNVKSSWLSREILFTMVFMILTGVVSLLMWFENGNYRLKTFLGWGAILSGFVTVLSMSQIYLLPTQKLWNSEYTIISYFGTTLLLGFTSLIAILLMDVNYSEVQNRENVQELSEIVQKWLGVLVSSAAVMAVLVLLVNIYQVVNLQRLEFTSAQVSLRLLTELYQPLLVIRYLMLVLGIGWLLWKVPGNLRRNLPIKDLIGSVYVAFLLVLVGEVLGRFLFYASHVRIGL